MYWQCGEFKRARIRISLNSIGYDLVKLLYPLLVSCRIFSPHKIGTIRQLYCSFQTLSRINNALNGLSKDMWTYAMLGYVTQKVVTKKSGQRLCHKVNPIYFEGAEGGFGIANALLNFYAEKLSYSRLQRDLSDSTVRRSFGIAFAYSLLSYQSVREGLSRVVLIQ